MTVETHKLHKRYGHLDAVADLDLPVPEGCMYWAAPKVLGKLVGLGSPEYLKLAEEIVDAWLVREPGNATALGYRNKLKTL